MKNMDRRKFLEMTSLLAGTSFLVNRMPWFQVFNQPAHAGNKVSDRIRFGFVGVGSRGDALLKNINAIKERMNLEVVAVCDTWPDHLEKAKRVSGGAEGFSDYREMFDKVEMDAVVIATPLHRHAEPTLMALEAGCHVFCEKAMARTLDDTKKMYDAHLEANKVLLIGHQRLYSPVYLSALKSLDEGKLGTITHLRAGWWRNHDWIRYDVPGGRGSELDRFRNWRLYLESSAGLITELGSHHFQIANWILDKQPKSVMGTGSTNFWKDGREVWDNYSLIFEYPDDLTFTHTCVDSNKHGGMQFYVFGNEGTMELETNTRYEEDHVAASPPALQQLLMDIQSNLFDTVPIGGATWLHTEAQRGGEAITDEWDMNETRLYLEAFVEFMRKGKSDVDEKLTLEGYHASVWSLLAEEATKTGKKITLPRQYSIS